MVKNYITNNAFYRQKIHELSHVNNYILSDFSKFDPELVIYFGSNSIFGNNVGPNGFLYSYKCKIRDLNDYTLFELKKSKAWILNIYSYE